MTRRGWPILILLLCAAGCGRPLERGSQPGRWQREEADRPCRRDLILVDVQPQADGLAARRAASADTEFPADAIVASQRFVVATRAVRRTAPAETTVDVVASDSASPVPSSTLVEGTGVVIDRSGLVLTNYHVIRGAEDVRVWVPDRGWLPARITGTDPLNDLAVISVNVPLTSAAHLADAGRARLGQPVVALGYTPGRPPDQGAMTLAGRLTGLHQSLQSALDPTQTRYYGDLIESTVPLEPGYSGGALIDAAGAVVGINTAAVTHRRTGRRTGYAIPMSDYIRGIIARLALGQPVMHGYLGVMVCACDALAAGVVVQEVLENSPAARAGLRAGDTLLRIDHTPVRSAAHLAELVRGYAPGWDLRLRVLRQGAVEELAARAASRR